MIKIRLINSEEIYQSIIENKPFDKNLRPYSKIEMESVLNQFIESEEYEKCSIIRDFINRRFEHNSGFTFSE
jgi:protein-arginine kinase activator protein McsA